jgi:hypothetical protein
MKNNNSRINNNKVCQMAKSKTIKQATSNMSSAETAEVAKSIAIEFLKSADAQNTDSSQAGTFLARLKYIFRDAPTHHEDVLHNISSANVSQDFKVFAGFQLTDLQQSTQYHQQAKEVLISNAKILQGVNGPKPKGFEFAVHYSSTAPESAPPLYPELVNACHAGDLELAINQIMSEHDITEEKAEGFFKEVIQAFKELKVSSAEEDSLLSLIQEGTSAYSILIDTIDDYINAKTDKAQGPSPLQTHIGATDFQPS